jgi:hypothetical protein
MANWSPPRKHETLLEDEGSLLLSLVGAEQGAGRTQSSLDES